ncbi:hypothetical protein D3C78_542960 [compost metagenome]
MFDRRGQGDRYDEQDGLPVERWCGEIRDLKPRRGGNLGGIDHAKGERQGKPYQHPGNDRHQAEDAFAKYRDDQGGEQRRHGNQHGGLVRHQYRAVTALAHGHVGRDRCHGQADGDDHRADHHGWQHAVDEAGAFDLHHQAHEGVHEACGHHAAHGLGQAELAFGEDDRSNEGKARGQEYRDLTAGDQLEQQGADTRGEQRDVRVQAGDQRHQHQRAKCHEEHLRARNDLAPERVVEAVLHGQASFCLVPKILSPASPRPGTI